MRLGGRVAQIGDAVGGDRRDQRVLGCGDARLVQKHVGTGELCRAEFEPVGRGDLGAQLFEREHMRVQTAAADDVAAGRRQHHFAAAGEQGAREQDRGADADAELGVEIGGADALGVDMKRIAGGPFRRRADRADQLDQRLGVADPRHVLQRYRMLGEQGGGDDRQRRILVAGRLDRAREPVTALDDVLDGRHGVLAVLLGGAGCFRAGNYRELSAGAIVLGAARARPSDPKRLEDPHGEERGTRVSNHEGPDIACGHPSRCPLSRAPQDEVRSLSQAPQNRPMIFATT